MAVTSLSVSFIGGKRYLHVSIEGVSAGSMLVEDEGHCVELLGLLWPELSLQDRADIARGGGISNSVITRQSTDGRAYRSAKD